MTARPNLVAGIGIALLALAFGVGAADIDAQAGYAGLSPRFLAMLVALGLAACALRLLWRRDSVFAQAQDADTTVDPARGRRRLAWVAGGLLAHMALVGTVGFVLASTLLMVCVARGYGSTRPGRDAVLALALTAPMWLVFAKLLGVGLPLLPAAGL